MENKTSLQMFCKCFILHVTTSWKRQEELYVAQNTKLDSYQWYKQLRETEKER